MVYMAGKIDNARMVYHIAGLVKKKAVAMEAAKVAAKARDPILELSLRSKGEQGFASDDGAPLILLAELDALLAAILVSSSGAAILLKNLLTVLAVIVIVINVPVAWRILS